ncbi:probable endochitinase [Chrysoperla carnea]|uniref:probable endochitinase n=1 Tax=Chrysoperla carnea TaxID=189513 RepID=UPI001D061C25|nr:probable endochitinase [Chrysoperla carnea]
MRVSFLLIATIVLLFEQVVGHDKKVVCYYGSWATYRPGNGNCEVEKIDPTYCTHAIYTFVGINEDATIRIIDPYADLPDNYGKDGFGKFNALKKINPNLKTLIAIGGWNEGSTKFSHVMNNPELRAQFVKNSVDFVLKYGFDGFDFDWEYPNQRGGIEEDKEAYIATIKELHEAFKPHGLLLSSAVAAAKSSASLSYLIPKMSPHLDIINLMAYDLNGGWNNYVGINAPLYPREDESEEIRGNLNVEACIKYWMDNGVDPKKVVLGMPLYGRSFRLVNKDNYKPGAPASGKGIGGPYSGEPGMVGLNEILEISNNGWTHYWEPEGMVPYMVKDYDWIGYENELSIALKTQFAMEKGLGGVMIWSLETDDLTGFSGQKFVFLKTINNILNGGSLPSTTSTPKPTTSTADPSISTTDPSIGTTGPTLAPGNICTKPGFVRDPDDCSVFYMCEESSDGSYTQYRFECSDGLYFNEDTEVCDYAENVQC